MTNCVNCGAVLKDSKCEYCGTKYNKESQLDYGGIDPDLLHDKVGILIIKGERVKVYLKEVEEMGGECVSYRNADGLLCRKKEKTFRRFELLEMQEGLY